MKRVTSKMSEETGITYEQKTILNIGFRTILGFGNGQSD